MDLTTRMIRTVRKHGLFRRNDSLLLALSGGPDSTCLLHLLHRLREEWPLRLAVLHVNHGLREGESEEDERFVLATCGRLGVPAKVVRAEPGEGDGGVSLQDRARALRAEALLAGREEAGADRIATGHNRDDRAETTLYHLFRGSGPRGLAGILPRSGPFVRPLIDAPRSAIEEWLKQGGIPWRLDRTNKEARYDRNRIRLEWIPAAERLLRRSVGGPIARSASILADLDDYLRGEAERWLEAHAAEDGAAPLDALADAHPALAAEILRRMAERAGGAGASVPHGVSRRLLEQIAEGREADLPLPGGAAARTEGGVLRIGPERPVSRPYEVPATLGRPLSLPEGGTFLCREEGARTATPEEIPEGTPAARLDADRTVPPYSVRNRRPGDRFRPLGAPGTRKLQDLFTDRKIPRWKRDRIPLLVDREGILWAAGVEIAERARVTRSTARILTVAFLPGPDDT